MENNFISVTQLNTIFKNIFVAEELLHNICVAGEVSGIKVSGGHAYFTIKDENAQLPCCCFNCAKTYLPKDSESVFLYGSPDFYVKGGRLSFNVNKIEPIGMGLQALRLEQLKKRLSEQGYFDASKKKKIPTISLKICVLTSLNGAVIRDIVTTLKKNNAFAEVDIVDVKVQGNDCAKSIVTALKKVDTLGYDVILIARGGGSFEDLMPFNDEGLVYAIFEAKTPVVSAVGHETDFTLCDMVADLRVATPTAAAEYLAVNGRVLAENILSQIQLVGDIIQASTEKKVENLSALSKDLIYFINEKLSEKRNDVISNLAKLEVFGDKKIKFYENLVDKLILTLEANNPLSILKKGFFKIKSKEGFIKNVEVLSEGENISIYATDGIAEAVVTKVEVGK